MNNGDNNNNVVPNTTNTTNNNTEASTTPVITNTVSSANTQVTAGSGATTPSVSVPSGVASSFTATTTPVAEAPVDTPTNDTSVSTVATPSTPVSASNGNNIPHSQPVLNPSTDVDFKKVQEAKLEEEKKIQEEENKNGKKKKTSNNSSLTLTTLLFLIIVGLGIYVFYSSNLYKTNLEHLKYNCTPVNSSKEDKQLDLNSTIVTELYNKVKTSIREDYAQPEFNDTMKLYLAWRQIPQNKYYGSNCNMFKDTLMEPYKCDPKKFTPQAFKEEDLKHELKVLFGEETNIPLGNIKLQNNCIGGYAYIAERGEFVEGKCDTVTAISYSVDKKLKEAYTNRNTITLVEEVKYKENEKLQLPDYLKSGTYYYTFRLDMNFNYVLIEKIYEDKY